MNAIDGSQTLEQFSILAKSSKGLGAVALIQQVLSNRHIFVFGEFLVMENLQALRGTEHEPYLDLLELFAYGTYSEYKRKEHSLPKLQPLQIKKLRQLSILTLAHQNESIPYSLLFEELGLNNVRELEDLIIETIDAGLLRGRLDQRRALFRVKYAIGRDIRLGDIENMKTKLMDWIMTSEKLLAQLEEERGKIQQGRLSVEEERRAYNEELEKVKATPNLNRYYSGKGGGGRFQDPYDEIESVMMGGAARSYGAQFKRNRLRDSHSGRSRNR